MNVSEMNTKNEIMAEYTRLKEEAERKRIQLPEELAGLNKNYTKAEFLEAAEGIDRLLAGQAESDGEQMSFNVGHSAKKTMQKSLDHENPIAKEEQRIEAAEEWTEAKKTGGTGRVKADASDIGLDMLAPEIIEKIRAMESIKEERMKELNRLIILEDKLNELAIMTNNRRECYFSQVRKQQESLEKNASDNAAALEAIQESNKQKIEEMQIRLDNMKKDMEQALKERDNERANEKEKYEYELAIKQKLEDDLWEDECEAREKKLTELKLEIETLSGQQKEKEEIVDSLQASLDELPAILEKVRQEAEKEREKELTRENERQTALAREDAKAACDSLEQKIKALQEDYDALLAEKEVIQAKLDKAYDDSNKLYLQTVQSTGGIKILGNGE